MRVMRVWSIRGRLRIRTVCSSSGTGMALSVLLPLRVNLLKNPFPALPTPLAAFDDEWRKSVKKVLLARYDEESWLLGLLSSFFWFFGLDLECLSSSESPVVRSDERSLSDDFTMSLNPRSLSPLLRIGISMAGVPLVCEALGVFIGRGDLADRLS